MVSQPASDWTLLHYRIPREPSTPRIAVWRQLRNLGVAQLSDGLVALPASARNTEQLQWVAAKVLEADGEAIVWAAQPTAKRDHRRLVESLEEARSSEYRQLLDEIDAEAQPTKRTVERWRRSWRAIDRRDYTDAPLREDARAAIADRAAKVSGAAKGSAT